jgi:hypothetical protein
MRERSLLCFFARAGHIAGFEILTGLSDKDAIAKAHLLFSERGDYYDAFEIWDGVRFVISHPNSSAEADQPRPSAPDYG